MCFFWWNVPCLVCPTRVCTPCGKDWSKQHFGHQAIDSALTPWGWLFILVYHLICQLAWKNSWQEKAIFKENIDDCCPLQFHITVWPPTQEPSAFLTILTSEGPRRLGFTVVEPRLPGWPPHKAFLPTLTGALRPSSMESWAIPPTTGRSPT